MATEYLLVLEYDIEGTTASIITQKGDIVSQGCHFINLIEPRNNWSEFNALESIYGVRAGFPCIMASLHLVNVLMKTLKN